MRLCECACVLCPSVCRRVHECLEAGDGIGGGRHDDQRAETIRGLLACFSCGFTSTRGIPSGWGAPVIDRGHGGTHPAEPRG